MSQFWTGFCVGVAAAAVAMMIVGLVLTLRKRAMEASE